MAGWRALLAIALVAAAAGPRPAAVQGTCRSCTNCLQCVSASRNADGSKTVVISTL